MANPQTPQRIIKAAEPFTKLYGEGLRYVGTLEGKPVYTYEPDPPAEIGAVRLVLDGETVLTYLGMEAVKLPITYDASEH